MFSNLKVFQNLFNDTFGILVIQETDHSVAEISQFLISGMEFN